MDMCDIRRAAHSLLESIIAILGEKKPVVEGPSPVVNVRVVSDSNADGVTQYGIEVNGAMSDFWFQEAGDLTILYNSFRLLCAQFLRGVAIIMGTWWDKDGNGHSFPAHLLRLGKPSKGFISLQRMLARYTGKEISMLDLYKTKDPSDRNVKDREFLAFDSSYCHELMAKIRRCMNASDRVSLAPDYIVAAKAENGFCRHVGYTVIITTPGGKEKKVFV